MAFAVGLANAGSYQESRPFDREAVIIAVEVIEEMDQCDVAGERMAETLWQSANVAKVPERFPELQ